MALLPGQRPGSVRLQIDMRVNKVCLCGGAGQPDSRCVYSIVESRQFEREEFELPEGLSTLPL